MPDLESMTPGQILADASVADFIGALGLAIAEAQTALDANSVNQLPEFLKPIESLDGKSLIELGLSPAFYHYQHADLACSLQLTLKVGNSLSVGVGLNGSYGAGGTSTSSDSSSRSETESGSSTATSEHTAQVNVTAASTGALTVGSRSFPLTGPDALTRIRALQDAVTADPAAGVPRLLFTPPADTFTITTDAPPERVATTERTVSFLGGGFARGYIRIDTNADTEFRLNGTTTVTTTAQSDMDAYGAHVAARIDATDGYEASFGGTTTAMLRVHFPTGRHTIEEFTAEGQPRNATARRGLELIARMIRDLGLRVRVEGHTDTQPYSGGAQASDAANLALGQRRADEVRDALIAYGAPATAVISSSTGVADARAAGGAADQVRWRNADILLDPGMRLVRVFASGSSATLEGVGPANLTPPTTAGNAWIYLYAAQSGSLAGKKVTIDGTDFALNGSAGGGAAAGTPEAHASNLSALINGTSTVDFTSSSSANVVTVYRRSSPFSLALFTTESTEQRLSGTEGVTVTRQFTRTSSTSQERTGTGNSTVAFGGTIDVRYSRQYETTVTGNSSISARLVSIPAPPQFLETIQDFLNREG